MSKNIFRLYAYPALLCALVVAVPIAALARAGGGQGYGGGGGGGGFGGDDYGGLWGLWPLLFLGHGSGFGSIAFFLIILWIIQRRSRAVGMAFGAGTPDPGTTATVVSPVPARPFDQSAIDAGLAAIKLRDPNFD